MPNPFYRQPQQMNPMLNMMNQFNQFRNTFSGDPKQIVANMLQSGRMSKTQFEQLSQMAMQFKGMMGR
jgi:hypothetical protein